MSNYKSSKLNLYDSTNFTQLFEIKNDLDKVSYTSAGQSEFNASVITFVKKDVNGNTVSQIADVVGQIIETKDGLVSEASIRAIEDGKLDGKISDEASVRAVEDGKLDGKISNEASIRASEDVKLDGKISDEASVRAVEDGKLDGKISNEASIRASEDVKLDGKISDEVKNRADGDSALDAKITTEKQRIDAIMSGASVDLNTFVEVVNYVNSLDSTQLNLIQNLQTQVNALQAVIDSFVPLSGRGGN
jgi:vacuolar-type H+-ATPase subunit I/STV1